MPTIVDIAAPFRKQLKQLANQFPAVLKESKTLIQQLKNDERPGDLIPNVGYDVYKVRLANPSARRGKSGGFRIIYYARLEDHVVLLFMYSKTEQSDVRPDQIRRVLEDLPAKDDDSK